MIVAAPKAEGLVRMGTHFTKFVEPSITASPWPVNPVNENRNCPLLSWKSPWTGEK